MKPYKLGLEYNPHRTIEKNRLQRAAKSVYFITSVNAKGTRGNNPAVTITQPDFHRVITPG